MATLVTRKALDVIGAETGAVLEVVDSGSEATVVRFMHSDLDRVAGRLVEKNESCEGCAELRWELKKVRRDVEDSDLEAARLGAAVEDQKTVIRAYQKLTDKSPGEAIDAVLD